MINFKHQEIKSYFKIILIFIIFISIIFCFSNKYKKDRKQIINEYELKISKLDSINTVLKVKDSILTEKIDSLKNEKQIIYIKYDKKIKFVYDASAANHAEWLDSIVKMNSVRK